MFVSLEFAVQTGFLRFACTSVDLLGPELAAEVRETYGPTFGHVLEESPKINGAHAPTYEIRRAMAEVYARVAGDRTHRIFNDGFPETPVFPSFTTMQADMKEVWEGVVAGDVDLGLVEAEMLRKVEAGMSAKVRQDLGWGAQEILTIPRMDQLAQVLQSLTLRVQNATDPDERTRLQADVISIGFVLGARERFAGALRQWPRMHAEFRRDQEATAEPEIPPEQAEDAPGGTVEVPEPKE